MASANSNDKLIIFKGDDTGGVFGRRLTFTIEAGEGVDLSGCRAEWIFDGIVKTFAAPLIPGEVREVFYSHNETRCMALGVRYGTFRIIDAAGKVRTLTNTKPVEVTNDAARCYPGASAASFVVHGIGDMKHSEFADLEEKEGMTLNEVGSMVNTLIRKLKGTISAFASLLAFGAFADGAITPQTDFGDISPTAKISTVISDAGAVMIETDPTVPAWAKQANPPQTMTTNAVDRIANAAVETNALTVATTNRVALLESSKADKSALAAHVTNTDNPHAVTAAQVGAVGIGEDIQYIDEGGYNELSILGSMREIFIQSSIYGSTLDCHGITIHEDVAGNRRYTALGKYDIALVDINNPEQNSSLYFPEGQQGTIALQNWQSLSAMLDSTNATTLAENPTFSNAVLAVGLNMDTNSVAVLNEIAETFGGFPIGGTATTVGGLLAALAAAVAWLKKNKVGSFASVGGASATVENGVAKLSDFFTESNSLLTETIKANAGGDDEKMRAVFSTFARMDDFTTVSDESDSFDVAITKLSQLLGEDVAA